MTVDPEKVKDEIDRLFREALEIDSFPDMAAILSERTWEEENGIKCQTVKTTEYTGWTPPYTKEHVATAQFRDLLLGIHSSASLSLQLRIGGRDYLDPHVFPTEGGYLPLKVPMICWRNYFLNAVCDRPSVLTFVFGSILDDPIRQSLGALGAFQRLPNGRLVVFKGCVFEPDEYDTTTLIEL